MNKRLLGNVINDKVGFLPRQFSGKRSFLTLGLLPVIRIKVSGGWRNVEKKKLLPGFGEGATTEAKRLKVVFFFYLESNCLKKKKKKVTAQEFPGQGYLRGDQLHYGFCSSKCRAMLPVFPMEAA